MKCFNEQFKNIKKFMFLCGLLKGGIFMWYSANRLLTLNCLFNFVISNRGGGKTYDFKIRAIKRYIKNGSQFIYLRRYKSELKTIHTFFNDIIANNEFKEHELKVKGNTFYCDGKICGYAIALSTALTLKSTSFPLVDLIGYDEFIIDKGAIRYLPNEVTAFLEMYETIARKRDNVRVIFMGNAISIVNPYFLYWNIQPDMNKRFNRYGHIAVEIFKDEKFIEEKKQTKFGQIIDGTEYGNYAIENTFINDNEYFIEKRTSESKFQCAIFFNGKYIGFWFDFKEGKIYASYKYDPYTSFMFAVTTKDFKPNMMLIKNAKKSYWLGNVINAFQNGYLFFENQQVKNLCYDMFRLLNI